MAEVIKNSGIPTLGDIHSGDLEKAKESNQLTVLLNQPPKASWIKTHPIHKKVKYLPIQRVEYLLSAIFLDWSVEVREFKMIANSVCVSVRLMFKNPLTHQTEWTDGVGAAPLQTDKDAGAINWDKIKNDAVMKALPAAESYAIKDAAEKLGKIFGKDLNRADQIMYDSLSGRFDNLAELKDAKEKVKEFETVDGLMEWAMEHELIDSPDFENIIKARKEELEPNE